MKRNREKVLELLTDLEHEYLSATTLVNDLMDYMPTDELNKFADYVLKEHDLIENDLE